MAAAIPYAASGIGALFQGIGRSKPQSSTSTYNQNTSSTQEANLSGKQKKVNSLLWQQIMEALGRGPEVAQSDRNTQRAQINNNFNSADTNLEANLAARGYGESGKMGAGMRGNLLERLKAMQGGEATLRDQAQNRFQQMIQNAFAFNTPRSFSSTGTSSGTSSSTMPGASPWSTIGSSLSDFSAMQFYRDMMNRSNGSDLPIGKINMGNVFGLAPSYPCAVAAELYGYADFRFFVARAWLLTQARNSFAWRALVVAYILAGPSLVWLMRRSARVHRLFKSIFDKVVIKAMNV